MKVYFSHGKESGPWGSKIKALAAVAEEMLMDVESIDYTDLNDPDQRVLRLLDRLKDEEDDVVLVGSSMGGYVSTVASMSHPVKGLFLLAPALYIPGYQHQQYPVPRIFITVIHGWEDDVIPYQHSVRFCSESKADLHLIDGDHRLNDRIYTLKWIFKEFLRHVSPDF